MDVWSLELSSASRALNTIALTIFLLSGVAMFVQFCIQIFKGGKRSLIALYMTGTLSIIFQMTVLFFDGTRIFKFLYILSYGFFLIFLATFTLETLKVYVNISITMSLLSISIIQLAIFFLVGITWVICARLYIYDNDAGSPFQTIFTVCWFIIAVMILVNTLYIFSLVHKHAYAKLARGSVLIHIFSFVLFIAIDVYRHSFDLSPLEKGTFVNSIAAFLWVLEAFCLHGMAVHCRSHSNAVSKGIKESLQEPRVIVMV